MAVELTPRGSYGWEMPAIARPLLRAMIGLNAAMFRPFGTRMKVMGRPLLLLTTVGARSGKKRRIPLGWFPDSDDTWLIVASAAGSARHPAWYINMAKKPDNVWIETGGRKMRVVPESLRGKERVDAWKRIVTLSPGYDAYQRKTDREIPVVRLRRRL